MKKILVIFSFFITGCAAPLKNTIVKDKDECSNETEYLMVAGKAVKLGCRPSSQIAKVLKVENTGKTTVFEVSMNSGEEKLIEVMQCDVFLETKNKIIKYRNADSEWLCNLKPEQLVEIDIDNEEVVSITSPPRR